MTHRLDEQAQKHQYILYLLRVAQVPTRIDIAGECRSAREAQVSPAYSQAL